MHDGPEETAGAQGEEKSKRKQPGKTELLRIDRRARAAKRESDKRDHSKNDRQSSEAPSLEVFAFRCWRIVQSFAHFFGASGFAGGLFSPGFPSAGFASAGLFSADFSRSARCSGATSAIAAP